MHDRAHPRIHMHPLSAPSTPRIHGTRAPACCQEVANAGATKHMEREMATGQRHHHLRTGQAQRPPPSVGVSSVNA